MELLVDCVLRNVLTTQKDLFDEQCTFVKFESESKNYDWTSGFQSTSRFGRILFRRRDGELQRSGHLVLKITPTKPFVKEFSTLQFFNEVFFYTRIWPLFSTYRQVDHLFPRYYSSLLQYNVHSDEGVIVFENVQARGYLSASKKSFLDYDHLALMLKKLGEFHAYSYRARREDPDHFHALVSAALETNVIKLKQFKGLLSQAFDRGLDALLNDSRYNVHHPKLRKLLNEYEEVIRYTMTGDEQNHTHVLCHGDFLRNNVLFKYENGKPVDLKLVDLATWRFASPAYDLASVLYLTADQEMREQHWDELIDVYYTSVRSTFPSSEVPSKDSILAEFKTRAMNAYIVASYFLPTLIADDSNEISGQIEFMERMKEEIADVDFNFDSIKEALNRVGGEKATRELSNILKDIIDRGYV